MPARSPPAARTLPAIRSASSRDVLEKNPRERYQKRTRFDERLARAASHAGQGASKRHTPKPASQAVASIAVLPFVNRSASAEDEYFSTGLADELLNVLAKIKGLA
jgi:hypothetical protein